MYFSFALLPFQYDCPDTRLRTLDLAQRETTTPIPHARICGFCGLAPSEGEKLKLILTKAIILCVHANTKSGSALGGFNRKPNQGSAVAMPEFAPNRFISFAYLGSALFSLGHNSIAIFEDIDVEAQIILHTIFGVHATRYNAKDLLYHARATAIANENAATGVGIAGILSRRFGNHISIEFPAQHLGIGETSSLTLRWLIGSGLVGPVGQADTRERVSNSDKYRDSPYEGLSNKRAGVATSPEHFSRWPLGPQAFAECPMPRLRQTFHPGDGWALAPCRT